MKVMRRGNEESETTQVPSVRFRGSWAGVTR